MMQNNRRWAFYFFFLSGFCGLLYQIIWLRLAFHAFGVITPVISVVVSVFMLGLALGSWVGGKYGASLARRWGKAPLFLYGCTELLIAVSCVAVPFLFHFAAGALEGFGEMNSWSYLFASACGISLSLLPWCFLMGLTYPLMIAQFEQQGGEKNSFSFLYLANVIGAMVGTLLTAYVLIEVLGFHHTLLVAGVCNVLIGVASLWIARQPGMALAPSQAHVAASTHGTTLSKGTAAILFLILFTTGFSSMALEVVWTRAFTAVLDTTVYAFAALVASYLLATWVGSYLYRRDLQRGVERDTTFLLAGLALTIFLPVLLNDPRINQGRLILLSSIFPMCAFLGYLTPKMIDEYSGGNADRAGRAYAINILGCILGPLLASYVLLPLVGSKLSMLLLGLPFAGLVLLPLAKTNSSTLRYGAAAGSLVLFVVGWAVSLSYEESFAGRDYAKEGIIRRDHTATVISYDNKETGKHLYVNGVGITILHTTTKWMAHLPAALLETPPEKALVICFGMGTTFRSFLTWPELKSVTAVELVPSVKQAFSFYHPDAEKVYADPRGQVVVDDGRRFLKRNREKFDIITLDPPPPIQAAGSGMLYSREFLELAKSHLSDRGILAHWIPGGGDKEFMDGSYLALKETFPHVRILQVGLGWHFLASFHPLPRLTGVQIAAKMPPSAVSDVREWEGELSAAHLAEQTISTEMSEERFLAGERNVAYNVNTLPRQVDDRPINEYFKVRNFIKKIVRTKQRLFNSEVAKND